MKFTLNINQKQALKLGMNNVNQVIILGLIADAHSWATPEIVKSEVYYWTARTKIAEELPLLNLKPDSVYRHLKSLVKLGLIDYIKVGVKDCVKLTKNGKKYYVGNKSELDDDSEINPSKLGNKSENHSEINPTYKNTNLIRVTSDNNNVATKVATHLLNKILTYKPNFKRPSTLKAWIEDIDKAMRLDARTEDELMNCIDWIYSNSDNFWAGNIMSGRKLREKFDTIETQMMKSNKKKGLAEIASEQGTSVTEQFNKMVREQQGLRA